MTRGFCYWLLMFLWLVLGLAWHFALFGAYGVLGIAIVPFFYSRSWAGKFFGRRCTKGVGMNNRAKLRASIRVTVKESSLKCSGSVLTIESPRKRRPNPTKARPPITKCLCARRWRAWFTLTASRSERTPATWI